ncbi:MAG: NAD(P)/FAD-dependent oxidoreductase [Pseudomonadota bacterium]
MEVASAKPRVVIIGAGFGGLSAARALSKAPVDIQIIDKRNYHLFQPLLYQVATADLSPADIAWPIRAIFSNQKNVGVTMALVDGIDLGARQVHYAGTSLDFDKLIIATGTVNSYFGHDEWEAHAPGLKRIVDATEVRRRVLLAFERAELTTDAEAQRRHLNFVVVGGGPTGVEMAGAIAELAHVSLARDFRNVRPADARIVLIEAGSRVLASFPKDLSDRARHALEKLGVEIWLDTPVKDINQDGVETQRGFLPSDTVIWGAGVKVANLEKWLGVETDRGGRVDVSLDLSLPGHPDVFVIGDAARVPWQGEELVPGIAPAAKQEGDYVGKLIAGQIAGKPAPAPFRYRHLGNLATIGRNAAVIDFGRIKIHGALAWWLWGFAHIYFLIGIRRPVFVALSWLWSYLTHAKGARLITGAGLVRNQPTGAPAPVETTEQDLKTGTG